jgi:acetylornithine deacetylase/succinyl-diaminopimelate desuccinylase-like protein
MNLPTLPSTSPVRLRGVTATRTAATLLAALVVWAGALPLPAQQLDRDAMARMAQEETRPGLHELIEILAIPNVAADTANIRRNAEWLEAAFAARGFDARILPTEGNPLVWAERRWPGNDRTVLFYAHFDGQPVDPSRWDQPDPFIPVLKEPTPDGGFRTIPLERLEGEIDPDWRIFARSASDDTSPIVMLLRAIDALEREGIQPTSDIRVILDGEEEAGSPSLPGAIRRYRELLEADAMLIIDGPRHPSDAPTMRFGARGILTLTLVTYGPARPQHSGHFGNWAPNPARRLAHLLASMSDDQGRVTIPGFYDGIEIPDEIRPFLDAVPDDEAGLMHDLAFAAPDSVGRSLQEALQYPSLNVRGMASGWVGPDVRTIIPDSAVAEIDVRLVVESDGARLLELIKGHIRQQGFHLVEGRGATLEERRRHPRVASIRSELSYPAYRTEMTHPALAWVREAVDRAFEQDAVFVRTSGGTVPISPFVTQLGLPAAGIPTVNPDNNQHSPNENVRIGHFTDGIRTLISVLTH